MYSIVTTQQGSKAIYFDNNLYRLRKRNKNGTGRWVCTNRLYSCCLIIEDENLQFTRGEHNHESQKISLSIIQVVHQIRRKVCNDLLKPITQIYKESVSTYRRNERTAESIPMFNALRLTLYRDRSTVLPKLPKSLHNLLIPAVFTKNLYNENMLFFDNKQITRILGFASLTGLKELDLSDELKQETVKREIANILSLPLLQINKIIQVFYDSRDTLLSINQNFETFTNYVEKAYIINPKFSSLNWNHYTNLSSRPRTNS
ncbi:unnamed protein product, partial [Rotaria magnacalcarata]